MVDVYNADGRIWCRVSDERGFVLAYSGKAVPLEYSDGSFSTVRGEYPKPSSIVLRKYVSIERRKPKVRKKSVLIRDGYTCQYCGGFGNTVDHILPKSRGGGNTWENLACACTECNSRKGNRTPKEAGMPLMNEPNAPMDGSI